MERNCEACKYYVTSEDGKTKGCSQWICEKFTVTTEECIEAFEGMKKGVFPWFIEPYCDKAISALRQQEEMTNGKIFMTLFPETNIEQAKWFFGTDWWNAPYKAESEVKPNETIS